MAKPTVGILTTYFAANYGAMLQPFALKRAIEALGCDVEILRYKQDMIYRHYNPFVFEKFFSPWYRPHPFYPIRVFFPAAAKELKFRRFMRKYLGVKTGFDAQVNPDKDYYVIGSDQLWRKFGDRWFDEVYLGNFPTKPGAKKLTYAVSGEGMEFTPENVKRLHQAFDDLSYISMREEDIAENYRKHVGGKEIEVVLDPSLLVDPAIYEEIEHINPLPGKRFCFFYCIRNKCLTMLDKIHDYCTAHNLELVIITEGINVAVRKYAKAHTRVHYLESAGEEQFLGSMKYADCVFTPSFHGTAFAIIYHKRFFSLILNDGHDTRPKNLLAKLGLQHRALDIDTPITDAEIDYTEPDAKLKQLREDSKQFLIKALNL